MNEQKLQAKVTRRVVNTPDVVTIHFTVEGKPLIHQAGQYITVYFNDTNVAEGKAYSLSSYPSDDESSITVKKVGLFSGKIHKLKVGDIFSISNAYGFFNLGGNKPIVALAGGVGIVPIWSIIRDICANDKNRQVVLLYTNKTVDDIIFRSEIQDLMKTNKNFSAQLFVTREKSNDTISRRIDLTTDVTNEMLDSLFYICGSVDFSRSMWRQLGEIGISEDNISTETFFEAS